jgi:hypothetical protein
MKDFLTRNKSLLAPCCDFPHLLVPRSGMCITDALISLGEEEFLRWRYWNDPSADFVKPSPSLEVGPSTPSILAEQWRAEAYGASFPELFYLPVDTNEEVYRRLTGSCSIAHARNLTDARPAKLIRKVLKKLKWAIAPFHVAPFMEDEPTYYCLVFLQDTEQMSQVVSAMSERSIRTFHLSSPLSDWPVSDECEEEALRLWELEISSRDV